MVALLEHDSPRGQILTGFDTLWGFSSPLIGPDADALVAELTGEVLPTIAHHALAVAGVPVKGALMDALVRQGPAGFTGTADRCVADLSGGFDAWLGRRSSRFRRSLRVAASSANAHGLTIELLRPSGAAQSDETFARILELERRSWKTSAGSGLVGTDLGAFTRDMAQRFSIDDGLRVGFAHLDGADVGYVIGGIVDTRYRGFQHSFDQRHSDKSIGKFLQWHNIAALCDEGITSYDMGMHMAYKDSYIDRIESTTTVILANRA